MEIFLKGKKVSFAKPELDLVKKVLSEYDIELQQYLGLGGKWIFNEDVIKQFYDRIVEGLKNRKNYYFVVVNNNKEPIGILSVHVKENGVGSIGIAILKKYRNKGYGKEALKLGCFYAFKILGLRKIVNEIFDFNEVSKIIHEKLGFRKVGIKKEEFLHMGRYRDVVIYEILKNEYENLFKDYIENIKKLNNITI